MGPTNLHRICDNCDSEFYLKYDSEQVEDDPSYCPFCGELLIEFEITDDDE